MTKHTPLCRQLPRLPSWSPGSPKQAYIAIARMNDSKNALLIADFLPDWNVYPTKTGQGQRRSNGDTLVLFPPEAPLLAGGLLNLQTALTETLIPVIPGRSATYSLSVVFLFGRHKFRTSVKNIARTQVRAMPPIGIVSCVIIPAPGV